MLSHITYFYRQLQLISPNGLGHYDMLFILPRFYCKCIMASHIVKIKISVSINESVF